MLMACFAWVLAGSFGAAAQTEVPTAPAAAATVPDNAELAATQCAIGEERILPGDYYYCLGQQSYGEQRYGYAKKFFTTAASWASKPAQYVLAVMALDGDHQPMNRPLALAWLALASERPESRFKQAYSRLNAQASVADRKAAEQWLIKLRPVYADATAAVRAERRYAQGMATINHLNATGGNYCMEGTIDLADASIGQPDPSQCPPIQKVVTAIDQTAARLFDGWSGHVSVGPLQQVNVPVPPSHGAK